MTEIGKRIWFSPEGYVPSGNSDAVQVRRHYCEGACVAWIHRLSGRTLI